MFWGCSLKLSVYHPLFPSSRSKKKVGQKILMNSKGWHLSQNVTLSFLLVTNIFRLKVRHIDIPLSLIINIQPLWNTMIHLIKWTQEKALSLKRSVWWNGFSKDEILDEAGKIGREMHFFTQEEPEQRRGQCIGTAWGLSGATMLWSGLENWNWGRSQGKAGAEH